MKLLAFCIGIFVAHAAFAQAVPTQTYTWTDPSPTGAITSITVPSNFKMSHSGQVPPPQNAATSVAPHGLPLTTVEGTWKWGSAADGRPGEYNIILNGTNVGIGVMLKVANGETLYASTARNGWYVWRNGWSSTAAPQAQ